MGQGSAPSGEPVARLLAPVITRLGLLVGLMALIAVAGVVASTLAFDRLTADLQPASAANDQLLLDLTEMEGAVSDWARSGQTANKNDYLELAARVEERQGRVRRSVADDPELRRLVEDQQAAAQEWRASYADPRVATPGGPRSYEPGRFRLGQELFDEVVAAHEATRAAFDSRVRAANEAAQWRFRGTIVAVLLLALLAWYAIARARARLLHQLSDPLIELESVVHKMATDQPGARADEEAGPREVRAVAAALNELADAQARALAVEARVQAQLRRLDTAKDDFLSNVSHELRTPLTTISGYLELVEEDAGGTMPETHRRMVSAARRNVARLKLLIDDLLSLSRAENRTTDIEVVDVAQVVRDAVTDIRITAAGRGIRVEVTAPPEPMPVLADRAMLPRAFLNVLTNAVKFSRDGGTVEVRIAREGDEVEVTVTDQGIGIPEAEVERLGTRFFRASNAVRNEIAGTGLGVRIVQTIVEKHAGDVRYRSVEGEGTTVALRLPLQAQRAA